MDKNKFSSRFARRENIPSEDFSKIDEQTIDEQVETIDAPVETANEQVETINEQIDVPEIEPEETQVQETQIQNSPSSTVYTGIVQHLLSKDNVDSVMISGTKSLHIEIGGKILNTEMSLDEKELGDLVNTLLKISGNTEFKGFNNFITDKYEIIIVGNDVCLTGINITIKKKNILTVNDLIKNGMMTEEIYDFLISAVDMKKNIVISGGINSGKTVLTEAIVSNSLKNKRAFVIENSPQLTINIDTIVKFKNGEGVVQYIAKSSPEYLICDMNYIEPEFIDIKGALFTVRSNTVDSALQTLIGMCVIGGLPSKFAKTKALKNFDYIVHLEKFEDGISRVVSIVELTPAKTMQASINTIVKYVDGEYLSQIPQPITSMRAKSLRE